MSLVLFFYPTLWLQLQPSLQPRQPPSGLLQVLIRDRESTNEYFAKRKTFFSRLFRHKYAHDV